MIPEKWGPVFGKDHALAKHDPEKACPGLDPGWEPVFGKNRFGKYHALFVMAGLVTASRLYPTCGD